MAHRSVSARWRALSLILIGLVAGTLLLGTAAAHIGTPNHLWKKHIKAKVKAFGDKRWQRKCRNGSVLAYAYVDASGSFSSSFTSTGVTPQFNCAGGAIEAKRTSPGVYSVRIPGLSDTVPLSADFVASTNVSNLAVGPAGDEKADYNTATDGTERVIVVVVGDTESSADPDNLDLRDDDFVVVVYGVGSSGSAAPTGGPTRD